MNWFKTKKNEVKFDELFAKTKIPILLSYEPFQNMIQYVCSPKMRKEMQKLEEMVNEEKTLVLEVNSFHKEKSRITASILYLSDQINQRGSASSERELDRRKTRMQEMIESIKEKEDKIQELRQYQEEQNLVLLQDTVEYVYGYMKKDEKSLDTLLKEIERKRQQLNQDRERRDNLKKRLDSIYGFMHSMMGAKDTERFDSRFFEEENDD